MPAPVSLEVYNKVREAWVAAENSGNPELAWALFVIVRALAHDAGLIVP